MNKWIVCIIALIIGMLMYHMLSNVCGCNRVVEGSPQPNPSNNQAQTRPRPSVSQPVVNMYHNTKISVQHEYTGTDNIEPIQDQSLSLLAGSDYTIISENPLTTFAGDLGWSVAIQGIIIFRSSESFLISELCGFSPRIPIFGFFLKNLLK